MNGAFACVNRAGATGMASNEGVGEVRRASSSLLILLVAATASVAAQAPAVEIEKARAAPPAAVTRAADPLAATTRPIDQIQRSFDRLAADDSTVREAARAALLGLSRDDLPTLRDVVRRTLPLAPSQRIVLNEIVTHVYLSGDGYQSPLNQGFLGVRLPDPNVVMLEELPPADEKAGVTIQECMPGFAGYGVLREGDVVLGLTLPKPSRTPDSQSLQEAVSAQSGNGMARLQVLRQGRVADLDVRLSPRPTEASTSIEFQEFLNRRRVEAEQYWVEHFAPLFGPDVS